MIEEAAMAIEGPTDAKVFELYAEHFLAPPLGQGRVVVMDELGAHLLLRRCAASRSRRAELLFLPSCSSPDLKNPIGEAFSKIKAIVREVGARMREALVEPIAEALSAVTPEDAAGWFRHRGYNIEDQLL